MLKRLGVALAALFCFASIAHGAGTVPGFSLTPQFDLTGKVAPGCKLYVYQAGSSNPQNAYQDSGLTLLQPNPMTCDAAGRLPQWFVADGTIKLRLTKSDGTQIFVGDSLLVVGPSSGGGGGGTVDPTTILATGDFKLAYNTGVMTGFVRCNGRTIGSATSGATERANADTSALFSFLWGADPNLAVSGGRGVSSAADFAANKTLTLPDCRGRVIAGDDAMGNSAAGRLTASYFGPNATVLGSTGGSESQTLTIAQIPSHNHTLTDPGHAHSYGPGTLRALVPANAGSFSYGTGSTATGDLSINPATTGISIAAAGGGGAHPIVQPTILMTTYIKL